MQWRVLGIDRARRCAFCSWRCWSFFWPTSAICSALVFCLSLAVARRNARVTSLNALCKRSLCFLVSYMPLAARAARPSLLGRTRHERDRCAADWTALCLVTALGSTLGVCKKLLCYWIKIRRAAYDGG